MLVAPGSQRVKVIWMTFLLALNLSNYTLRLSSDCPNQLSYCCNLAPFLYVSANVCLPGYWKLWRIKTVTNFLGNRNHIDEIRQISSCLGFVSLFQALG